MVDADQFIDDPGRERGVLAPADREYLNDPEGYQNQKSRQAAYKRREEIPKRIRNSLLDMSILAHPQFPDDLLEAAFSVPEDRVDEQEGPWARAVQRGDLEGPLSDSGIEDSVVEAITLFHRMYPPSVFNDIVEEGVKQAVDHYYPDHEVLDASYEPDIRRKGAAHEWAKRSLEEGGRLTDEEIRILLKRGEIDPEEIAAHVREQPENTSFADSFAEWVEQAEDFGGDFDPPADEGE
jgi:hypothetical protein